MAYDKERQLMVMNQLRARGIKDERVLDAMGTVKREMFVPGNLNVNAYDDCPLPIGDGQTISQPYMVALMTELLALKGDEKVLEIGTGSAYQSAVLSLLASEVYTIERISSLAQQAQERLHGLGFNNVQVFCMDGSTGLPEHAPFDSIIVTAAAPEISHILIDQLKVDGRLVIPAGARYSQLLYLIKKTATGIEKEMSTSCVFVPLIGEEGWEEE